MADRRHFAGVSPKGYINYTPSAVKRVFGEPNGTSADGTTEEWLLRFDDDTPVALIFRQDNPSALYICGETVAALAKVREALTM